MTCESQHDSPLQARAASGDVRKDGKTYRRRSRACRPSIQSVKISSKGLLFAGNKLKHA